MAAMLRRSSNAGRSRKVPSLPAGSGVFLAVVLLGSLLACDICRAAVHFSAPTQDLTDGVMDSYLQNLKQNDLPLYKAIQEGMDLNSPYNPEYRVWVVQNKATKDLRRGLYEKTKHDIEEGSCGVRRRHPEDFTLFTLPKASLNSVPVEQLQTSEGLSAAIIFIEEEKLRPEEIGDNPIRVLPLDWIAESLANAPRSERKCPVKKLTEEMTKAARIHLLFDDVPDALHPIAPLMEYLIKASVAYARTPEGEREILCEAEEKKLHYLTTKCQYLYRMWTYFGAARICEVSQDFLCGKVKETLRVYLHSIIEGKRDIVLGKHGLQPQ